LTSAYDAAKTAATQASVNAIPTTPLLAANYTAPDNAGIGAIKSKTDQLVFTVPGKVDSSAIVDVSGLADGLLAANIEGALDLKDVLRIVLAFASGESEGGGGTIITYKNVAGTKDRITWTINTSGDRLSSTVDGSD